MTAQQKVEKAIVLTNRVVTELSLGSSENAGTRAFLFGKILDCLTDSVEEDTDADVQE